MEKKILIREDENVTIKEAYLAMYQFLKDIYERTQSDAVACTLTDLSLMTDGKPFDPASWGNWLEIIDKAKNNKIDARMILSV